MTASACLLALFACSCGDDHGPASSVEDPGAALAAPIIGGTLTEDDEFPAVVALGGCTGTLVHPSLVVYAEHCGTAIEQVRFGPNSDAPARVVNTDRCRGFPGARLGNGTDLAYCVLAEPVTDIEPERLLAGCELADFFEGAPAVIVGYGVDHDGGSYGTQRAAVSRVESIDDELFLAQGDADTCRGDSGGPVFIERAEPDGTRQRRLAGVTSAGTESDCGRGVGHYVNVTRKLEWLEQSSQLDLTPCFDGGAWSPTPRCFFASCGAAFEQPPDEAPPFVAIATPSESSANFPLVDGASFVEFELSVEASDGGWGVERVSLSLFAPDGELLFRRNDELAPYGLPTLRVPRGRFMLEAEARDFAGNTATTSLALQVGDALGPEWFLAGGACAWSPRASGHGSWATIVAAAVCASFRRRRMR